MLKKLCNHPGLLNLPDELEGSEDVLPPGYHQSGRHVTVNPEYSGKFMLLQRYFLFSFHDTCIHWMS